MSEMNKARKTIREKYYLEGYNKAVEEDHFHVEYVTSQCASQAS